MRANSIINYSISEEPISQLAHIISEPMENTETVISTSVLKMLHILDHSRWFISNKWITFFLQEANFFKTQWITFKLPLCQMPTATASFDGIKSIWASTVQCLKGCNSTKQFCYWIGGGISMGSFSNAPAFNSPKIKQIKSVALSLIFKDRSEHQNSHTTWLTFPLTPVKISL